MAHLAGGSLAYQQFVIWAEYSDVRATAKQSLLYCLRACLAPEYIIVFVLQGFSSVVQPRNVQGSRGLHCCNALAVQLSRRWHRADRQINVMLQAAVEPGGMPLRTSICMWRPRLSSAGRQYHICTLLLGSGWI